MGQNNTNTFEKAISKELFKLCIDKNVEPITPVKVDWHGVDLEVKPFLSMEEMILFIDGVVSACFLDGDNTYIPEVKDFAINSYLLSIYTNIELPDDISEKYIYVTRCDAFGLILEIVDDIQLKQILTAINEKIKYLADANVQMIQKQVYELYGVIDNMSEQFEKTFSGVNNEDMTKLISAIANGGFDETKLVDAYFNKKKEM